MKLSEALDVLRSAPEREAFEVRLICGFTPLHLQTFLAARLQVALPERKVQVTTGLYGDISGTLAEFASSRGSVGVLFLEWADLDPRLGFRSAGGWGAKVAPAILKNIEERLATLKRSIASIAQGSRLVIFPPTLPIAPAFHTNPGQASGFEILLQAELWTFLREVAIYSGVRVASCQQIESDVAFVTRYDFRSDLHTGYPYSNAYADLLARTGAGLLIDRVPKKGLITDLDDTLWLGLVGEVGHDGVSWDLASHSQVHGLYQQLLQSFVDSGVLVAIASKNSPEIAQPALRRADLLVQERGIYPQEIHWEPKSISVGRILRVWNVAPDSVVFVDDNELELEEVRKAFPAIECVRFPKKDAQEFLRVLQSLKDLFGRVSFTEDDAIRVESIRKGQEFANELAATDGTVDLLEAVGSTITFDMHPEASDLRVLELVNKTNQFNLNGRRYQDSEWRQALDDSGSFVWTVAYQDKFGPLGKIGVIKGRQESKELVIDSWVMSCRAFSRRIEHQTVEQLFSKYRVDRIRFDYQKTGRNEPLTQFLTTFAESAGKVDPLISIERSTFQMVRPPLYHQLRFNHDRCEILA